MDISSFRLSSQRIALACVAGFFVFVFFAFVVRKVRVTATSLEAEPRSRQKTMGEGVRGEGSEENRLQSTYIHSYMKPYFISNFRVAKNRLVSLL